MLAELAHDPRLGFSDEVTAHRDRAEHRLDDRDVWSERARDQSDRVDLVVQRLAIHQLNRGPRVQVGDRGPDQDRCAQPVSGGVIDRSKRLGEAARAHLELHEVPTKAPRPLDCDGGQVFGRPFLAVRVAPRSNGRPVGDLHRQRRLHALAAGHRFEFKLSFQMDMESEAARLRSAAEARPLRLPVNRKVDESHHAVTPDGLSVWYTIQDRMPSDEECRRWLGLLMVGADANEAPSFPGAMTRRFEAFERNPELEAPIA